MNVLLIQPTYGIAKGKIYSPVFDGPPLGLASIAALLEENGHVVRILDACSIGMGLKSILEVVRETQAEIVGIQALTNFIADVEVIAKKIKAQFGNTKIIVGGPHAMALPNEVAANPDVDFVCLGEGEYLLAELVECLTHNGKLSRIKGLIYKEDGKVKNNPPRPFITDLDSLPIPAYHLLNLGMYNPKHQWGKRGKWMSICTARGCPFGCLFCDVSRSQGRKCRCLSSQKVFEYIKYLNFEFGIKYLTFEDPTFTLDLDRVYEICTTLIQSGINIEWGCNSRIDTLPDDEGLKLMRRAGCNSFFFGIESGDSNMLRKIKELATQQVIENVHRVHKLGFRSHCAFIIGLPGETRTSIRNTIEFISKLKPTFASISVAVPYPGTKLYNLYKGKGYILTTDWSKYESDVVISLPDLSPEYLKAEYIKAHRRFYLKPRFILGRLVNISSPGELIVALKVGLNMLFGKCVHRI